MHIARELIDPDADKVVRRLARHGYQAYLVGGCVRDLLLSRTPKDFDVATSATPTEIKDLFRNCRIIGRRFRLAHIFFGGKIIETSTFRANPRGDEDAEDGEELLIRRDNVFGSDTEDAQRRDFTINGLFYDVEAERVIDHVGGLDDLRAGLIRTIGDADIRFREDPVRMMRAIKFAARLGFEVEGNTFAALVRHRGEITKCAQPRVLEEVYRLLRGGAARRSMELLVETGVVSMLSPRLAAMFGGGRATTLDLSAVPELHPRSEAEREEDAWAATWSEDGSEIEVLDDPVPELELGFVDGDDQVAERREHAWNMLGQVDRIVAEGAETTNALVLSACAAPFVVPDLLSSGVRPAQANEMIQELLVPLAEELRIARRDAERTRQVLLAQRRLAPERRRRGKPMALVRRDYFDESLTIYELLAAAAGVDITDADYWRRLQSEGGAPARGDDRDDRRRRRRRGGRRRRRGDEELEPALG